MSLQKESEWKEQIRDWWYRREESPYEPQESERVELEHIVKNAIDNREKEIADEVKGKVLNDVFFINDGLKTAGENYNRALSDVLSIIKH